MLRVRKRSVNCLYLPISWSGPCRLVFLGPAGGENVETKSWDHVEGDLLKSGRGPLGSRHLFVEAARPDTPLVYLRLLFAGGSSPGPLKSQKAIGARKKKSLIVWHAPTGRRVLDIGDPRPSSCDLASPAFSSCANWILFLPFLARYPRDILISLRERQHTDFYLISYVSPYQLFLLLSIHCLY